MRRRGFLPLLIVALILLLSLPLTFVERLRQGAASLFSLGHQQADQEELLRRQVERLKSQNRTLKEKVVRLVEQIKTSRFFAEQEELSYQQSLQRRREELIRQVSLAHDGVHARIIYRSLSTWNSGCWVDVGQETNERLGYQAVGKNSPVLYDGALVGVVEEVTACRARIRFISDPSLTVAVRAKQKELLAAKGELTGSSSPLWSRGSPLLAGRGFNYDFADAEGPARPLKECRLYPGDLLVTTGLDGLFPSGLPVATIAEITPLKEGDYAYSLKAQALIDFEALHTLFILPPLGA